MLFGSLTNYLLSGPNGHRKTPAMSLLPPNPVDDVIDEEGDNQITSVSSYLKTIRNHPGGLNFRGGMMRSRPMPPPSSQRNSWDVRNQGGVTSISVGDVSDHNKRGAIDDDAAAAARRHLRISNSIRGIQGMLSSSSGGGGGGDREETAGNRSRKNFFTSCSASSNGSSMSSVAGEANIVPPSDASDDNSCASSELGGCDRVKPFPSSSSSSYSPKFVNKISLDGASGSLSIGSSTGSGQQPPVAAVPAAPRNMRDVLNKDQDPVNGRKHPTASGEARMKPATEMATAPPAPPAPQTQQRPSSSSSSEQQTNKAAAAVVKKLKQLEGYVGFANLPNQVYRKAVKRGFEFTLMVVGESGLGKSTLVNSMFLTDVYSKECPGPSARLKKTVQVETNKVLLNESGVNLTLTVVDTPGFGDAVDNSNCWDPVTSYVESQYEAFLDAETRVNRVVTMADTRVHACLYFIAPSGHGLKPLDVEFMKRLHDKVNIIPVIGKADTLTPEEVSNFKRQILNQIAQSKIRIYEFPDDLGPSAGGVNGVEDEKERRENRKLKERVPFAVVGSNALIDSVDSSDKKIRGRKYPWGVVDIENMAHCDFVPLRNMLIRTHLQDLKEVTNNVHYENFRCRKLAGVAGATTDKIPNKNPLAQIEEERREHQAKMTKMEREMEEVFERKVREKRQKLADSKADLEKRNRESREELEQTKLELAQRVAAFEQEKVQWEQMNRITVDELSKMSLESLEKGGGKKKGRNSKSKLLLNGK